MLETFWLHHLRLYSERHYQTVQGSPLNVNLVDDYTNDEENLSVDTDTRKSISQPASFWDLFSIKFKILSNFENKCFCNFSQFHNEIF